MANIDTDYVNQLVTRFNGFKSPNDTQRLIIALGEKLERSDDDNKKLAILLKAEKKADELMKARAETNKVLTADKAQKRKSEARKKIIWGAALKSASQDNAQIAQIMQKLYNDGYVADKDKDAIKDDIETISSSNIS